MAVLKVLTDDHPTLRLKSEPIVTIDTAIKKLARDMVQTMHHQHGVGLAAVQVGVLKRLIVVESPPIKEDPDNPVFPLHILVNPAYEPVGDEKKSGTEGCLSIPGWYGPVTRYCKIAVTAQDLDGKELQFNAEGFLSRVIQHEVDHLEGILFTDYIDDPTELRHIDQDQNEEE